MDKQFPTREKATFIVCEDVRQELGGKFSLHGVFGTRNIILENVLGNPEDVEFLQSLAVYISFSDGEGEFSSGVQLLDPDGNDLLEGTDTDKSAVIGSHGINFTFKFSPFAVKVGTYRIVVSLDGKDYEETFNVARRGQTT